MKNKVLTIALLALVSGPTQADGFGDILKMIVKQVKIAGFSLDTLKDNFGELKDINGVLNKATGQIKTGFENQVKETINQQKLMKGNFNLGKLFNNPELNKWQRAGATWSDLTNLSRTTSDQLGKLSKELIKKYPVKPSNEVYSEYADKEQAELYDDMSKTAIAMGAQSKLSYNSIEAELKVLESLQKEIDNSDSQKKTLDLIARVSIENAKINAFRIRNEAMQANATSMSMQQQVNDEKWASNFLKWN